MKELYAYLSLAICEMVTKMAKRKCLGCIHNRRVHLNHMCKQTSLLEKFEQHYDQALVKVMGNLKMIVDKFTTMYPVYTAQSENCCSAAHNFLSSSTTRSIYYGGYCEDEDTYETMINGVQGSLPKKASAPCRSPKRAIEKTKPAPVKRLRKNAPVPSIETVLSEAYDEVYKS